MTGELSLFSIGNGLLAPTECAEALLSLNELTQSRGLVLSPEQALALEQQRAAALEETGRLEMGQAFCRSSFTPFTIPPAFPRKPIRKPSTP